MTTTVRILALAIALSATALTPAWAQQKHMQNALDSLQQARAQLDMAKADKGGHREKAIDFIEKAIDQVRKGMEFAREHN